MTIEELLNQADEQITYPFEKVIEHCFPLADTVTDYVVCLCGDSGGLREEWCTAPADKKEAIMQGLWDIWEQIPLSAKLHNILDSIFTFAMSALIDTVVAWLNHILPDHGWAEMSLSGVVFPTKLKVGGTDGFTAGYTL